MFLSIKYMEKVCFDSKMTKLKISSLNSLAHCYLTNAFLIFNDINLLK